ncbi:MAG: NAD(P)/FAD-dependent oxidoreductase [Promethearchaeota archaeon]|nr:MAG: NAD(P)/FAD-dependent oxidoreductase [Candidatus Lokiarchaeota archaeon]
MTIPTSDSEYHQIIILGCGPSSLSAAIQLKRANIPFLLIADEMGGLVRNANLIENLLGFPGGISGKKFAAIMEKFIETYQVPVLYSKVIDVRMEKKQFWVTSYQHLIFNCDYLIIGTGTIPNLLQIPGEIEAFSKYLLFYELYRFKDKREGLRIGIVGGGDAAYDYALNLGNSTNTIEILQRRKESSALPILINRVQEKQNIGVTFEIVVKTIIVGEERLELEMDTPTGLILKTYDFLFVTIGRSPNMSFLSPELKELFLEGSASDLVNAKIWFIGDIKNKNRRQLAIAMGDGIKAAMDITAMLHK